MSEMWLYQEIAGALTFQGMLERYKTAKVSRRLRGADTLQVDLFYENFAGAVDKGYFIGVSEMGAEMYPTRIFRVEQVDGDTIENTVSARCMDASSLFTRRPVEPAAGQTHDSQVGVAAETAMHYYVNRWAGPAAPVSRRIPNFVMGADGARGGSATINARYQSVDEVLQELTFGRTMGWEVVFDYVNRRQVFQAIVGTDRRTSIILSPDFESVKALQWMKSDIDNTTYAIVGGQGEGAARTIETRWEGKDTGIPEPTGWDWRGVFLDAGDVSTVAGLRARADAELAKATPNAITADINVTMAAQYKAGWNLGDIVRFYSREENLDGVIQIVQVDLDLRAGSDPNISVSVDRPFPTIFDRLEQSRSFTGKARS